MIGSSGHPFIGGSEPLSILQVLEKGDFHTGSVVQMFQLARGLSDRGHRVAVVTRPGTEVSQRARAGGIDVVELPMRHEFDLSSARRLARVYRDRSVELLHAHKGIAHSIALAATFLGGSRPVLVANRGVSFPLDRWNRWKYRVRLGAVVTVCEDIKRVIVESGRIPTEKVHVVYAGVDPSVFDPQRSDGARVRREWGIGPDQTLLVQVSAREYKGWRDLLAGAARISKDFPELRVALVACPSPQVEEEVRRVAASLGIGDRVLALGYRSDMPDVLAAADVVADLSWGGLGITGTLREAMALERPVIASSAGGNPELVEDGRSGLLVAPRDPEAFAGALRRLLEDPALSRRLALGGRERVRSGFTVEKRLDRIEAVYRRLIDERARAAGKEAPTRRGR